MRRRALRVSGSTDKAEHGPRCYRITNCQSRGVRIEMRVVINAAAGADHRNCLATETVLTDVVDKAPGRGEYRRTFGSKNVLPLVQAGGATRRVPGVGNPSLGDVFQRHRNLLIGL